MVLDGPQLKRLQDALISAYPTRHDLERMVSYGLGEHLSAHVRDENLEHIVFELLRWAQAQGRLEELMQAACSSNPGNQQLRRVTGELGIILNQSPLTDASSRGLSPRVQPPRSHSSFRLAFDTRKVKRWVLVAFFVVATYSVIWELFQFIPPGRELLWYVRYEGVVIGLIAAFFSVALMMLCNSYTPSALILIANILLSIVPVIIINKLLESQDRPVWAVDIFYAFGSFEITLFFNSVFHSMENRRRPSVLDALFGGGGRVQERKPSPRLIFGATIVIFFLSIVIVNNYFIIFSSALVVISSIYWRVCSK